MEEKKGWSWLGFLFAQHYYAGYGDLKKGVIYAILGGFPLFAIIIAILCGKNATNDLPIGKKEFNWVNVAITVAITIVSYIILKIIIQSIRGV